MHPAALALLLLLPAPQGQDEARLRPDGAALKDRFTVRSTRYDTDRRQFVWTLVAKVTAEEPCHYDVEFLDADDERVVSKKLEFKDGGTRTEQGKTYQAVVKYPTRKQMEKVAKVVVRKSD
jgi:hypothetical protein